jgi:hypothetical protein
VFTAEVEVKAEKELCFVFTFVYILFSGVASCWVRYQNFIMVAVNRKRQP